MSSGSVAKDEETRTVSSVSSQRKLLRAEYNPAFDFSQSKTARVVFSSFTESIAYNVAARSGVISKKTNRGK